MEYNGDVSLMGYRTNNMRYGCLDLNMQDFGTRQNDDFIIVILHKPSMLYDIVVQWVQSFV